ncbi:MAG: methyltransferase domain-containing protein [Nitrospira sp.]|nr:methyltransferase domain-containing protein [Nitrospira sp.]
MNQGQYAAKPTTRDWAEFCCPECMGTLMKLSDAYSCPSCERRYPIQEGIPCFSELSTYHGEVPKDLMTTILKDSERLGYRKAFEQHIQDPFIYKYVDDESRSLWINIIPHGPDSTFLDVGCGWGTNAAPISQEVGTVIALDATFERVKFVQIRCRQDKKFNVVPILGSAIKLPLPDNSVDIVAFNGVLEWLGGIDTTRNPVELQQQALREAWRVLRPDGYVYIGIENRYSLRYMLGDQDDHSFMKYTSLMPRGVANLYCRLRTGGAYFTYTHSLAEYHRFLREAQFANVRSYFPWPDYRNPTSIVSLEREAVVKHLSALMGNGAGLSFRQRVYLTLLKLLTVCEGRGRLCHSFCFVAQK